MAKVQLSAGGLLRVAALGACGAAGAAEVTETALPVPGAKAGNLLVNPTFEFHAFMDHRTGSAGKFESHNVAFWNTAAWGDITVMREAHAPAAVRPAHSAGNLVRIEPGKRIWQFLSLPELGLAHGAAVSLHAAGYQSEPGALTAEITFLKLDSEDGTWTPAEFGMADKRTFPRHSRGELVAAGSHRAVSSETGAVTVAVENALVPGTFHPDERDTSRSDDINTIGLRVTFANRSESEPVWLWWPSLGAGQAATPLLPPGQAMIPWYTHIPRTMQKLWKGEALHIVLMGSSIDRGSANPPMYLYDEDPDSPTFKQPLSDRMFEASKVNRPDLDGYVGWWQHYWNYAGRLRLELMRKFNLPVSKLCLNVMACDGSCVGEAHSGLADYCSLSIPPGENANGHAAGRTWQELYPELFSRPGGPGPDLVIFGSGANEKTDTPHEVAVFEGAIRWIQRHYPHCEFLFCMFQNAGAYTPNAGDLQALALRYQIPYLDYGKLGDQITRWCNRYALVPRDGHPQAAAHYLWFKQLEKAFECWTPIMPGQVQCRLPERVHPNSYGWEGDMLRFIDESPRLKGNMFIFEDTAVNCWGAVDDGTPIPRVDGVAHTSRRSSPGRDVRNSMFRFGSTSLGDRHILEIEGPGAVLTAVDAKVCPGRRYLPVGSAHWEMDGLDTAPYASEWGAPYGTVSVLLEPGRRLALDAVGTDLSAAYVDAPDGGTLTVSVDGAERLRAAANSPYTTVDGTEIYLENRRGIRDLQYGLHRIELAAEGAPVRVLGVFSYDSRSNRAAERVVRGQAAPGEIVHFSAPFRARPVVVCTPPLAIRSEDIHADRLVFSGSGVGQFEAVGE